MTARLFVVVLALAIAGCRVTGTFACERDDQCQRGSELGACQPTGYCGFADQSCASGSRYDTYAGRGLAGECVVATAADASIDTYFDPLEIRINVGGGEVIGVEYFGTWTSDVANTTCPGSSRYTVSAPINGTIDDALFQDVVYVFGTLACSVPSLPPGMYRVTMLFGEVYYGCGSANGPHLFDIALEGVTIATGIDTEVEGGGCVTGVGYPFFRQVIVSVTDGALDLAFTSATTGILSALEVVRVQ